jgi:N-acetylmuramic acid 6-phosphate etherase
MSLRSQPMRSDLFLGIEGGATRTLALLADNRGRALRRIESGPANLRLLTDAQLTGHLRAIAAGLPRPAAMCVGLAGASQEADRERIRQSAAKVWRGIPCHATNDLETALAAADLPGAQARQPATARVLVLSGTGSCCYGVSSAGQSAKVGGWGHLLGDKGSGYEIGLRALKAVVYYYDRDQAWPKLGERILRALQLNAPQDLIAWAHAANKAAIAGLAVEVFSAWQQKDKIAADILAGAAASLARDAAACAQRLAAPRTNVRFVLAGGVLLRQPRFGALVSSRLRQLWPRALVNPLTRESVWGAVELARGLSVECRVSSEKRPARTRSTALDSSPKSPASKGLSPTERRNPRSMNLDKLPLADAIALMLSEEATVPRKLLLERRRIEQVIQLIVRAFRRGGRLFYVGAGTSGRLGVLDASECPPTFGVSADMVQGLIAGGTTALWQAVEGAEDDAAAGHRAIQFRGVQGRDVVAGIAASGTTPFVWGALQEAKQRGAATVLLCFNPSLDIPRALRPTIVLAPDVGPEVLTGSTRLKCGTATKLLLNLFTTLAMVRLGKVISNLMVDLNPANRKLRDRAARMVREVTGADYPAAQATLERSGWRVKDAIAWLNRRRRPQVPGISRASTKRSRNAPGR